MSSIGIALGGAAVKWIGRLWLSDTLFEGLDADVIDAVSSEENVSWEARKLRRQLDDIADNIAERLEPFLSIEIQGIDEGERNAAARAAQKSLEAARAMNPSVVISSDMDASRLAALVRRADPGIPARELLGEPGQQLYDTLVDECSSYIISIVQRLPGYSTAQARELLGRTSHLAELSNKVLDSLPSPLVPPEWGPGSEDLRFENKYKTAVSEFANDLRLYGVTSATAKSPYPLSVAYISLSVDAGHNVRTRSQEPSSDSAAQGWADPSPVALDFEEETLRIEALLEGCDHLLLAGNAGSGKTTLVQWLASSTIQAASPADIGSSWRGRIPFIVPLRRYVDRSFPTPEEFVETIAINLAGAMPRSWVHRVLSSGRGMLLVDGLDEVPVERRHEARKWVLEIMRDFPDCKVLVTSRTAALSQEWRDSGKFREATLRPLEFADIRAFIHHWHAAVAISSPDAEKQSIESAEKSLLKIIRDRPPIRSLCTSPLLCALICALHYEGGANLPNNRMDVYKTALEMLVLRRDSDRRIHNLHEAELGYTEREILLRAFALWMHENGASDATKENYLARIAKQVAGLHKVKSSSDQIAHYLLERSGVLREPVPGRVDFVHRTFLEYLAAAAIVDDDSTERLILNGHDDHWREVIVMAAGHANSAQRALLLNGLLDRGDEETEARPRLYMLAVACMETSPDLSPELVARLGDALSTVLPPKNMTEAAAVASAGTLAVGMLKSKGQGALVAAACVRALSLIGGDGALAALSTYGSDRRLTVTRQLIRGWAGFEVEKYALQVLKHSPLDDGKVTINDADQLSCVGHLENAKHVYVSLPNGLSDPEAIPSNNSSIERLELGHSPWLRSLRDLPPLPNLAHLSLHTPSLGTLEGAGRYTNLRWLNLSGCTSLQDISALTASGTLSNLNLTDTAVDNLDSMQDFHSLHGLDMYSSAALRTIRQPLPVYNVKILFAPYLEDISGLAASENIRFLALGKVADSIDSIDLPSELTSLSLNYGITSQIQSITGASKLQRLYMTRPPQVILDWVADHSTLTEVTWNNLAEPFDFPSGRNAVERFFSNASLKKLTIWTTSEPPSIPGLKISKRGYDVTYSRDN